MTDVFPENDEREPGALQLMNAQMASIRSVDDWTRPKQAHQWKPGRSAMELAKAWCPDGSGPSCPHAVRSLLDSHPLTRDARLVDGRPEHVTPLPERGEGRNHDLWIRAEVRGAALTICVEAKADEPFGEPVGDYLHHARVRNKKTGSGRRARKLIQIVFGQNADPGAHPFATLRYQLLTAAAGTVLQAARDGADRAVLILHEFRSADLDPDKIEMNAADVAAFLSLLNGGAARLEPGVLRGPWRMSPGGGNDPGVELLIGKVVTPSILP